jgi:multidrug efflux system outer membrane protein
MTRKRTVKISFSKLITKAVCPGLIAVGSLTSCTLAPKYERPVAPVSQTWPGGPAYATNQLGGFLTNAAAEIGWREFFQDARLQKLIDLALTGSRDLRVAVLNVEQSRAQYRIQRADLLPTISARASGTRQRIPADILGAGTGIGPGGAVTYSQYSVSLGATAYELDLFGRVRSLNKQALENYFATEEARKSAHITLVAEVAIQYLTERQLDEQLALTRQTLAAVQSSYDLNKHSFDAGTASQLDLQTSAAQVQTARANVAVFERQRAQAENALVLLIGQPLPGNLPPPKSLNEQKLAGNLPANLPSNLLQRRPDILQAEHLLKAANANVGAARAAFFPKLTLTGSAVTESLQLSHLFSGPAAAWSFTPEISVPIFAGGRNRANLDVAKISTRTEVAQYEKTIQSAFREVADALAARTMLEQQIQAEVALVAAEQSRYDLADVRYRNGVESYLAVLTAQQDLYSAQQRILQTRLARLSNAITLYKALGGGWDVEPSPRTTAMISPSDAKR